MQPKTHLLMTFTSFHDPFSAGPVAIANARAIAPCQPSRAVCNSSTSSEVKFAFVEAHCSA